MGIRDSLLERWCAGRDLIPGHELGRLRCYPYITDAKAFEKRLALNGFGPEVLQERYLAEVSMMVRQKVGLVVMFLFVPINGPLWRMAMESLGAPFQIGEFQFFGLSVLLFSLGALMLFSPRISLRQTP